MIGEQYLPFEYLTIAPTEYSIAEYNYPLDVIIFWGWNSKSFLRYRTMNEPLGEMIIRVLAHEELHRILYFLEGTSATFGYDSVTRSNIDDLP